MLKLEPLNPTKAPAGSLLLNGVWEFLYIGGVGPGTLAVKVTNAKSAKRWTAVIHTAKYIYLFFRIFSLHFIFYYLLFLFITYFFSTSTTIILFFVTTEFLLVFFLDYGEYAQRVSQRYCYHVGPV